MGSEVFIAFGCFCRSGFTDVEIRIFFNRYHIDSSGKNEDSNINRLLAELEDPALKSSVTDFQGAEIITIDDFLLYVFGPKQCARFSRFVFRQEEKLQEIENMIILVTERVNILLEKLDTIDSVRKSRFPRH